MKRVLLTAVLLVVSNILFAQKDVTTFLGIPVDGFKPEMIQKLKGKGFVSNKLDNDLLEGEFNGTQVFIDVVTTNNKVSRITIADINVVDEADIKIRFNNLCCQFNNNPRYISVDDYIIPDDEDISFEMSVKNKRYEAVFYQQPLSLDTSVVMDKLYTYMLEKYTIEELENPTEDIKADVEKTNMSYVFELISKKPVWFIISKIYDKYNIIMYYDNEYNRASGEDL